jgi:hypothetical protein
MIRNAASLHASSWWKEGVAAAAVAAAAGALLPDSGAMARLEVFLGRRGRAGEEGER